MDEIQFTFDEKPFVNSIKNVNEAINSVNNSLNSMSKTFDTNAKKGQQVFDDIPKKTKKGEDGFTRLDKSIKKTGFTITNVFKILAVFGAVFVGIRAVLNEIPEIGATFKIAGEIIRKNLLLPLRVTLLPLLQKVLDWVKDNRSFFVNLGSVIVNVFKVVGVAIKTVLGLFNNILDGIKKKVSGLVKLTFGDIAEIINILLFKITAALIYLEIKLAPVFELLGEIFAIAMKSFKSFGEGFLTTSAAIFKDLNIFEDLKDIFGDLNNIFGDLIPFLEKIQPLFKTLCRILALSVGLTIKSVTAQVKFLTATISGLFDVLNKKKTFLELGGDLLDLGKEQNKDFFRAIKTTGLLIGEDLGDLQKNFQTVDDAIITKDGKVIKTNPQDNLIATKSNISNFNNLSNITKNNDNVVRSNEIRFDSIVIQVTGTGNKIEAENLGRDIGNNFVKTIRDNLLDQLVLEGAR